MCSQGGAPLLHFPQAFIEHFLIPMINIYVAFYSWLTPSTAMSSSSPPTPGLCIINPFWKGAEVPFPESQWNLASNASVLTQKFMNFPLQHTARTS